MNYTTQGKMNTRGKIDPRVYVRMCSKYMFSDPLCSKSHVAKSELVTEDFQILAPHILVRLHGNDFSITPYAHYLDHFMKELVVQSVTVFLNESMEGNLAKHLENPL